MQKSRSLAVIAGLVTVGLALAGCTGGGGNNDKDGVTTIQFWHRTFTPAENAWYADIVKKFNAAQSEVKVVDTEVPADAWDEKMKAAQAAGKAPDVYTHSGPILEAVAAGQLHELNGIVSDKALAEILPFAKSISAVGDKYYAYPLLTEAQTVLFWNKDLVSAAGVDATKAPETWDDLFAACEKIKPTLKDGQYCFSGPLDAVTFAWSTHGLQFNFSGHTALNSDWTAADIDNAGYRELMLNFKKMWDLGYVPKQAIDWYGGGKDFGPGLIAYKASGSWLMSEIGSDYPDMLANTGVGRFPSSASSNTRTESTLGNFKWVIDAKTKHAEAAGKFLEWAIAGDPENVLPFFVNTQFTKIPVRQSVQDAVAKAAETSNAPWSSVVIEEIAPDAIPEPTFPWDVSLAVGTAFESVMNGAASVDDAIKTAEDAIKVVIDRDDLPSKAPKG
ncbi:MAG: extracellular solute-binding protein [Cryobacterium sp.]|nr:extracellular solute-binding protein [Cryobacterium sp.]